MSLLNFVRALSSWKTAAIRKSPALGNSLLQRPIPPHRLRRFLLPRYLQLWHPDTGQPNSYSLTCKRLAELLVLSDWNQMLVNCWPNFSEASVLPPNLWPTLSLRQHTTPPGRRLLRTGCLLGTLLDQLSSSFTCPQFWFFLALFPQPMKEVSYLPGLWHPCKS